MQVFMVTGLFAGQHNTKLHGTITGVIFINLASFDLIRVELSGILLSVDNSQPAAPKS